MNQITHVIFDTNGTLLDIDVIIDLLVEFAKNNGKQITIDIRSYIREMGSLKDIFYKYFDSINMTQSVDRIESLKQLLRLILYKGLKLSPGVDKLIKHLYYNDIPMAIASSGSKRELDLFGQKLGYYFNKYFTHSVCDADDPEVIFNKPNPDVYLVCAKRFAKPPRSFRNVLVVEDSLLGITGAMASGMQTLLINDQKHCNFDLIADQITCIVDCFDNFRPESVGLPPFGCCMTHL